MRAVLRRTQNNLSVLRQCTAEDSNSAMVAPSVATYIGIACKLWYDGMTCKLSSEMSRVAGREHVCMSFTLQLKHGVPWLLFMLFFPTCAAANALTTSFSKKIPSSLTEGPQDVVVLMFGCCDRC